MRVLIVGAGAVGQVYGAALAQGGATVAFLVKPEHAEPGRQGFATYPLHEADPWRPRRLLVPVYTQLEPVAAERWDLIMPAVSGPALRGPWLGPSLEATPGAAVALLHAGMADARARVEAAAPGRPLTLGVIPFMAWHTPQPGEPAPEPGTAWWLPPLTRARFEGDPATTDALVALLNAGGLPAAHAAGVSATGAFGTLVLSLHMAALERAGWSFARLRAGDGLSLARRAIDEAAPIVGDEQGLPVPWALTLLRPAVMSLVTRLLPLLTPHDAEQFFKVHFTKVGAQTRDHLERWLAAGRTAGRPTPALSALRADLGPAS